MRDKKARKGKTVPRFVSDEEEAAFWATHDSGDYELGEEVEVEVAPTARTRLISIRLPVVLLNALKARADGAGIPYQRLIREILEGRVGGVSSKSSGTETSIPREREEMIARLRARQNRGGAGGLKAA